MHQRPRRGCVHAARRVTVGMAQGFAARQAACRGRTGFVGGYPAGCLLFMNRVLRLSLYRWLLARRPLVAGLAAALLATGFLQLGDEVGEGDTRGFDMLVLLGAQALRAKHPWLTDVLRDLSGLGSTTVLALVAVAAVGYVALFSSRRAALLLAVSVASGSGLVSVFKWAFGRLRPEAAHAGLVVPGWSFPSGHASMAAIVFLTLGALVAATRSTAVERVYLLAFAATMTVLVGLSRVGLGVHWATDVLGGWAFGSAWAITWWWLARTRGIR